MSLKLQVARALTAPAVGRALQSLTSSVKHHGAHISIDPTVVGPRVAASLFWGLYEKAETRFVRRYLLGSPTVVELGASLGVVGAHILRIMHPTGRYVAVEANPALAAALPGRLASHVKNQTVEVVPSAITMHSGTVRFHVSENTQASGIGAYGVATSVPATTLRDVIAEHNLDEFALVADIEGSEPAFILGDPRSLDGCSLFIAELEDTEWEGRAVSAEEQHAAVLSLGFRQLDRHGWVVAWAR